MATRRRSSGFSAPKEEETVSVEEFLDEEETAAIEEFLNASAREMFETISLKEEEAAKVEPVFVPQEITPTPDSGPRFVEETAPPAPPATPQLQPKPKRHPRNIPKFSRYK